MFKANRKNDAIISILQDNLDQTIQIIDANRAAEELVGFQREELQGALLTELLPDVIQETISDNIEFEDGGNDISAVLRRVRFFHILNKDGIEIPVSVKVFYGITNDGVPCYELLMRDITLLEKIKELREKLIEEKASIETIDDATTLHTKETIIHDIQTIQEYLKEQRIATIFATARVNHLEDFTATYGDEGRNTILRTLGERYNASCRDEDTIALVDDNLLGIMLFDCNPEDAPMVLDRLENFMCKDPIEVNDQATVTVDLEFSFVLIESNKSPDQIIKGCSENLLSH